MNHPASTPFAIRARWVLPVAGPPVEGGWVVVQGDRVLAVEQQPPSYPGRDLGDVALLPGLINAHTHLDLSDLTVPLGRPGMTLVDWIGLIAQHKFQQPSAPAIVEQGLRESARLGTTTLADVAQHAPPLAALESLGVGLVSFLELIAPTADRIVPQLRRAEAHLASAAGATSWSAGLSPHAPYSVQPDLLVRAVALSAEQHVPLAMHLAESPEELELLHHARGPFRDLLERLGVWDPAAFPERLSVLAYLRTLAGAHRALVIHGNYLADEDIAFLAAHADRLSVVYCPRTHAFFAHAPYPLEKMLAAGVTVALGTDSRASSPDLSVLAEIRQAYRRHPTVAPATLIRLATAGAAAALGLSHRIGTIQPGHHANLLAGALPEETLPAATDPYRLLLESDTRVVATWCRGRQMANGS